MGKGWRSWTWDSHPPQPEHSSVPLWEKTFCTSVCNVPWERICEAKGRISGYKNIADWDDSGSLEGFKNAKARYWAGLNGIPCETPMPDPDMYIDEVDHNAVIDPELVAELHKKPPPPPRAANEYEDLSFGAFLSRTLPVKATGWGDAEEGDRTGGHPNWEARIEKPLPATGWGDAADDQTKNRDGGVDPGGSWNERDNQSWGRHWQNWSNEQRRRNGGRRNSGYGPRVLKQTQQTNSRQPSSFVAGGYCNKTAHGGRPPTAMGQWLPKPRTLMNGQ